MSYTPIVDEIKCTGCEECVDICPVDVFTMDGGRSKPSQPEECVGCESCLEICPEEAIVLEEF